MTPTALWVTPVSNLAGVARHICDVSEVGLPGWDLVVAAPEGPLLERLRRLGTAVIPAAIEPGIRSDRAVRTLRSIIRQIQPDVVHTHLARADLLAAAAVSGLQPKLVSTEHGIAANGRLYQTNRVMAAFKRAIHMARVRRFDAIIGVSHSTKDLVERTWKPAKPVRVILNGIDRPLAPEPSLGMNFLSLARLSPEKNIHRLLEAFALVSAQHPDARLTIAGEGPLHADLVSRAAALHLQESVEFSGHVDAAHALTEHDVLVQLSAWENASYTLLDATVRGMGVVATPVGGNPEFLPQHCLASTRDLSRIAELMVEQATHKDLRPAIPHGWPTVDQMCSQVAAVYSDA